MIPFIALIGIRRRNREFRFWVPLILVWLLLMPILLLLVPICLIGCWLGRIEPFNAIAGLWQVLTSLNGTDIELGWKQRSLLVRLF
jgi:hypothetical protein